MPARRRTQEAKRAQRRAEEAAQAAAERNPPTVEGQIEAAYAEYNDHGWCCIDCDPNHPDAVLNDALTEIAEFKAHQEAT